MRSEKVGNAIDLLQNGIADDVISYYCTRNKKRLCDNYCEKEDTDCIYNQAIETVLDYIRHLENTANELYGDGYGVCDCRWKIKIKDKIKKLYEEYERFESETIKDIIVKEIQVLKELLEE